MLKYKLNQCQLGRTVHLGIGGMCKKRVHIIILNKAPEAFRILTMANNTVYILRSNSILVLVSPASITRYGTID